MMSDEPKADTGEESQPVDHPVAVLLEKDVKGEVQKAQDEGEIRKRVVTHFAQIEKDRRVDLLVKALQKRKELWRDCQKIKPDQQQFNEEGDQIGATWTKAQAKKRKESLKRLNKIDAAIQRAVEKADYEGLKKIAEGKDSDEKGDDGKDES